MEYKKQIIAVALAMGFSSPALAQDWAGGNPVTGTVGFTQYVAVDGDGNPVTDNAQINADGTFKTTCTGCSWVQGDPADPAQAQYRTPYAGAVNPATGNVAVHAADGSAFVNTNGSATVLTPQGLSTTGNVVASGAVVAGESYVSTFSGNVFSGGSNEVGSTLTSYGAALQGHQDAIATHETRITNTETSVGNLQGTVGVQGAILVDHGNRLTAAEGSIVTLQTDVGTLKGVVDGHGTVLDDHGKKIGSLQTTVDGHQVVLDDHGQRIGSLETTVDEHGKTLTGHAERITATEAKNTEQDGRLDGHDKTLASHGKRITTVEQRADGVDTRLNSFNGGVGTVESWATGVDASLADHNTRIGGLEEWRGVASGQIASLQGDVGLLKSAVDRLKRGVALATAITIPSVDIDKKIALTISGAGYDGEGAIAAAAAVRITKNVQGFVGAGTSFNGGPQAVKGGVTLQW